MGHQDLVTGGLSEEDALLAHADGVARTLAKPRASAFKDLFGSVGRATKTLSALIAFVSLLCLAGSLVSPALASPLTSPSLRNYARQATSTLLEVFQVYPPVLTVVPDGTLEITDGSSNATVDIIDNRRPSCRQTLVQYSFANSYGAPFVGAYVPPSCTFNRVTWNLTVVTAGRQYDRLAIVYLGDIEVFRTSTAEPTAKGIEWTYLKVGSRLAVYKGQPTEMLSQGYDKLCLAIQARPEDHLRPGQHCQ